MQPRQLGRFHGIHSLGRDNGGGVAPQSRCLSFGVYSNRPTLHSCTNPGQKKSGSTKQSTLISRNAGVLVAEHHSGSNSHVVLVGDSIGVQGKPIELRSTNREMRASVDV